MPSDPPLLLAAGYDGDLVAFDAGDQAAPVVWRFHTGGDDHGPPAYDAARGAVYFGSSDKRLYAVDLRGLYLWSYQTGDNVASRPLIVGDVIVFGSEDGNVYGLDVTTGGLMWSTPTGGPIVSSAALAGEVLVIGSDDGMAHALDPATGQEQWTFQAGDAIEGADRGERRYSLRCESR